MPDSKEGTERFMFIKREILGKCLYCSEDVYSDRLYVKDNENIYHYSCYNYMKAKEDKGR